MDAVAEPLVGFALSTLAALFVVVDPIGCVPLFVAITDGDAPEHKRRTAFRASLLSGVILALFAVTGTLVFRLLGVSEGAFRIAGGVLLFLLAVDMLRAQRSRQRTTPEEEAEGATKPEVSVFPLAIPALAGPGAISTVMVLVSRAHSALQFAIVLCSIALTLLATYWILRAALAVAKRLGQTGMNVLERVMGLVLATVAAQFVVDGVNLIWALRTPLSR
jgi:multiple antibiotic resistance protein